jgi:hypothetical protein
MFSSEEDTVFLYYFPAGIFFFHILRRLILFGLQILKSSSQRNEIPWRLRISKKICIFPPKILFEFGVRTQKLSFERRQRFSFFITPGTHFY